MENDNPADTEGEVGKRLSGWVSSNGKAVQDLFIDINLSMIPTAELRKELEVSMTVIEALGLKSLINIYCQNGEKFHADYFRERMMSTSIHVFVIYKIFPVLEAWRENCCKNSFVTPPTSGLGYQSANSSGSTNDLFSRQSPAVSSGFRHWKRKCPCIYLSVLSQYLFSDSAIIANELVSTAAKSLSNKQCELVSTAAKSLSNKQCTFRELLRFPY